MATFTVTTATDELNPGATEAAPGGTGLSLREAVALANASSGADTIIFDSAVFNGEAADLIRLTLGQIDITDTITIDGSTATGVTITGDKNGDDTLVAGTNITNVTATLASELDDNSRIFRSITLSPSVVDITLDSLTLTGGHTTGNVFVGGAVLTFGDLTVIDSTFSGNSTAGEGSFGGAMFASGDITLTNSTVSGNATFGEDGNGGGIYSNTSVSLIDSTVSNNSALGAGADGGGVASLGGLTVTNSTVTDNSATRDGGGIAALSGNVLTVTGSTVSNNSAGDSGGGIYAASVALTDTTVSDNSSTTGGGIYATSNATLTDSTVSGNSATGTFGATGGGIFGGNIVTLTNSTLYGNSISAGSGGGLFGIDVTLINSTVTGNTSAAGGQGVGVFGLTLTLTNSILVGNQNTGASDADFEHQGLTVNGTNIVSTTSYSAAGLITADATQVFAQTLDAGGFIAGVLADNGGPVQTVALRIDATNPALDASNASAPTLDARGLARQDAPGLGNDGANFADLGAYEARDQAATAVTFNNQVTSIAENSSTSAAIKVADIALTDADADNNVRTLSGADASFFEIVGNELFLKAGTVLDFETKSSYSVTVNADSPFGTAGVADASANFTLNVTDVNEAPTLALGNTATRFAENTSTAIRIKVADITVTDDALGTNVLSLTGADAGLFEIVGKALFIKAGAKLDFETNSRLDVTVNVNDAAIGGGVEDSRSLTITLSDVLETITGTPNPDTLNGGVGADRILGLASNDTINGGFGNDRMYGAAGNDRMLGAAGDDLFVGGLGNDRMTGGLGADQFFYGSIADMGTGPFGYFGISPPTPVAGAGSRDVITDFQVGIDTIDLSAIDANAKVAGNQAFTFLGKGNTLGAGSLIYRIFDAAGTANDKTIVFGDVNGDSKIDFQIELSGLKNLTANDFVL